jgi:hypothetical protein
MTNQDSEPSFLVGTGFPWESESGHLCDLLGESADSEPIFYVASRFNPLRPHTPSPPPALTWHSSPGS